MTAKTSIRTLTAVVAATGALSSSALAAGEPKNEPPFTRVIGVERAATLATVVKHASSPRISTGDSKNVLPFTRH